MMQRLFRGTGRGLRRRRDGLRQEIKPLLLEGDPTPGNDGDGSESEGERLPTLITKGEVEEDGIRSIIIISGTGDLFHTGKGDFQIDLFTIFSFRNLKEKHISLNPQAALTPGSFDRETSVVIHFTRLRSHHSQNNIALTSFRVNGDRMA
jgi:hypothetical protein